MPGTRCVYYILYLRVYFDYKRTWLQRVSGITRYAYNQNKHVNIKYNTHNAFLA
jgi:hypothetical protein